MTLLGPAIVDFLCALDANNSRDWFVAHKAEYESAYKRPAESFAESFALALGAEIGLPMESKIFRLHRDVRFSKDKTPYNTHLRIALSPSGSGKEGTPLWMVGIEKSVAVMGMGIFEFAPGQLDRWRAHADTKRGTAFAACLDDLRDLGIRVEEPELKRVPGSYPSDHPQSDLLRRKGLTAWIDFPDATITFEENGPSKCVAALLRLRDLHDKLVAAVG